MKNIVIIGAGDLGKELVWLIEDINKIQPTYVILGFLDDDVMKDRNEFAGYRVLGGNRRLERLLEKTPLSAVVAVQDGSARKKIVEEHPDFDNWESVIHPSAVIASSSQIGKGSVVFPNSTVSVDTKIGDFGLLYIHSTICNDCEIGDYVSVMTGATISEHVQAGNECYFSAGSCVAPHKRIEDRTVVEIEAIVGKDHGKSVYRIIRQ